MGVVTSLQNYQKRMQVRLELGMHVCDLLLIVVDVLYAV